MNDFIEFFNKNKKLLIGSIICLFVMIATLGIAFTAHYYKSELSNADYTVLKPADTAFTNTVTSNYRIKFTYDNTKYWSLYNTTNAVYKTQADFESAIIDYINRIAIFTEKQEWFEQYLDKKYLDIHVKILDSSNIDGQAFISSFTENSKYDQFDFTISSSMFTTGNAELVYGLTDIVMYDKSTKSLPFSLCLKEGLNQCIQHYIGEGLNSFDYGLDIHTYFIQTTQKYKTVTSMNSKVINIHDKLGSASTECPYAPNSYPFENSYWHMAGYSFVDYLIQTYGANTAVSIATATDENVFYSYHIDGLNGMISDWDEFLSNYQCNMTLDQVDEQVLLGKTILKD